jgi:nitrate reductase alpha subunit
MLLRLQRGGPVLWMALEDARDRAITDGMRVRVSNGEGSFRAQAKLSPALPPAHAILYHAWEPYQFPEWQGNMEVVASPYKALHFAGNYGHLRPRVFLGGPVHVPRAMSVEIERDAGA